jgi:hypothetical protein
VSEVSKRFFFEKKNQKTFGRWAKGFVIATTQAPAFKVFLLLFVHKKKCFLTYPTGSGRA